MSHRLPTYKVGDYGSSKVRLYGLPATSARNKLNLAGLLVASVELTRPDDPKQKLQAAIIFGYAYQGHCYDLPKPKVMVLPSESHSEPTSPGDCGYGGKDNYMVWTVDKLDKVVEIDVSEGEVEELVLQANLPGRRSPQTYRSEMQLAHRSGRLTE